MKASWVVIVSIFLLGWGTFGVGGLGDGESLLFKVKPLSPKGRILNHTAEDYKWLQPKCPCVLDSSSCDMECCYCQLECPVPLNSFSQAAWFPPVSCSKDKQVHVAPELQVRRPIGPWKCEDTQPGSRLAKMFCIYYSNLEEGGLKVYHRMNVGWTSMKNDENEESESAETQSRTSQRSGGRWDIDEQWNWKRSAGNFKKISAVDCKHSPYASQLNCPFPKDTSKNNATKEIGKGIEMGTDGILLFSGVNFTKKTDVGDSLSTVEVFTHPTFTFKALAPCTEFTSGKSLDECEFSINTSSLRNCDQVLNAVKMTTEVVSFLFTNRKSNVTLLGIDEGLKHSDSKGCMGTPIRGIITEVLFRESFVGIFVNFTDFASRGEILGSLTLSYTRVYVSDKQLHNLPRFWSDFFYGNCSEGCLLRDFTKVGPPEAWRFSRMEHIVVRNLVLLITLFIPFAICVYLGETF